MLRADHAGVWQQRRDPGPTREPGTASAAFIRRQPTRSPDVDGDRVTRRAAVRLVSVPHKRPRAPLTPSGEPHPRSSSRALSRALSGSADGRGEGISGAPWSASSAGSSV